MFYTNRKHWTTAEENFVTENADKMTTAEIARKINRTEVAVQQYMHRKRINPYEKVVRNLLREILTKKFTNPEYFNPNRSFYDSVGITQKRWWDLYYGRKPISDNEYKKLSSHFGIELDDIIVNEQLNLFDNADSSGDN